MVNVKELEDWVENTPKGEYNETGWNEFSELEYTSSENLVSPWGAVEWVDGETGREGGGEEAYMVFKIGDQLFQKDGYYASHEGTSWDGDLNEVEARDVQVTRYFRKS